MVKVHGSRMVGSLLTPSRTFAVFNGMDAVPTFDTQIEQRGKIMLQNIRYGRLRSSSRCNCPVSKAVQPRCLN